MVTLSGDIDINMGPGLGLVMTHNLITLDIAVTTLRWTLYTITLSKLSSILKSQSLETKRKSA